MNKIEVTEEVESLVREVNHQVILHHRIRQEHILMKNIFKVFMIILLFLIATILWYLNIKNIIKKMT